MAWGVQGRSLGAHAHSLAPLWAPLDTYAAAPGTRPAHLRGSELASPFLAKPVQNEFCGIGRSAQEPAGPRGPLRAGRWVYEKREGIAAGEEAEGSSEHSTCTAPSRPRSAHLWPPRGLRCAHLRGCELASPFLAKPIQNEFCGIGRSTQEPAGPRGPLRAGRWVYEKEEKEPLWGGCRALARHLSTAAFIGSFSPISYFAAFAWCPTVCRGTDDCGEHHPSTTAAPGAPQPRACAASGKTPPGAREYPMCAEGWAMWVVGGSPDLSEATGGTYRLGKPSGAEPPGRASSWGA